MANDFVKQQYNKLADNYAAGRDQFKNNKYLDKLSELLPKNAQILDIGCGAGIPIDSYFIEKGHRIIGIDISEKMIDLAKKNVHKGEYKVEDMSKLKEGEYNVDAIVSFYAIFHTPREQHQEILNKFYSFLKKGGYMLITMASNEWEGKEGEFFGGEMYWSHYDAKTNTKLVENSGFEILINEIDTTGGEKHQVILAKK